MNRTVKIILLVGLAAAVIGGGYGLYLWNKPHLNVERATPAFVLTAEKLMLDFQDDENNAHTQYAGRVLQVSGVIAEIKPHEDHRMEIILETGDLMSRVSCTMQEKRDDLLERNLSKGDEITLKGLCSGILMDIVLERCVIVTE